MSAEKTYWPISLVSFIPDHAIRHRVIIFFPHSEPVNLWLTSEMHLVLVSPASTGETALLSHPACKLLSLGWTSKCTVQVQPPDRHWILLCHYL